MFGRRGLSLLQNLWSSFPFGIQSDILDRPSSPDVLKARCAVYIHFTYIYFQVLHTFTWKTESRISPSLWKTGFQMTKF